MTRLAPAALLLAALVSACSPPPGSSPDGGGGELTWYRDVLPVAQQRCLGCHVAGGIAPFSLEEVATAQAHAAAMSAAVAARRMPPWMPAADCGGPFAGDRSLTQQEIDTFVTWAQRGAAAGDPADAPAFDGGVPQLPRVDQTIQPAVPYTPDTALTDDYRCFLVDPALAATKYVIGYDIAPQVRAEVHHVIVYVVDRAAAQARDDAAPGPGWQCFGGPGVATTGALGAWAPGMPATVFPAGTGIALAPGKALAIQIHYNLAAGVALPDQSTVKLMYAQGAVTPASLLPLVADGFSLPPMTDGLSYSQAFPNTSGRTLKLWGFLPHMHTLGARITLTGPGAAPGNCLVDIPRWDFHWQQSYFRTAGPATLASGESVTLSCTWNNPTARTITWGEGTADEMCFAFVYATP